MDINIIYDYIQPVILLICLAVGYIIKNLVKTDKVNKYIPLIVGILGVVLSVWVNGFNIVAIAVGLMSGLCSTGLYELFKNLINKEA